MKNLLRTVLLIVWLAGSVALAAAAEPTDTVDTASAIPQLRVATLGGAPFDLATQRGKWVVINYWATWCSPCLKEMPDLDAFARSRDDVAVIGLAYEDISVDDMRTFLVEHPVSYPIAIIDVYEPPAAFPAPRGLPMTWLIAPEGQVAKRFLGPITARDLEQAIAGAGKP